jgi:hypothetical protein
VLSGRGLCDELITRPEESYRMCCVVVCDLETSRMGAPYIYDISRLRVKRDGWLFQRKLVLLLHLALGSSAALSLVVIVMNNVNYLTLVTVFLVVFVTFSQVTLDNFCFLSHKLK